MWHLKPTCLQKMFVLSIMFFSGNALLQLQLRDAGTSSVAAVHGYPADDSCTVTMKVSR